MPKHKNTKQTIYGHANIYVDLNHPHDRKSFLPEYWGYIYRACKIMCPPYSPFDLKEIMYPVRVEAFSSSDLLKTFGYYKDQRCMITMPYVLKKRLVNVPEGGRVDLTFTGFLGYVPPEDRFVYFDTARYILDCIVHYEDDAKEDGA